MTPLFVVGAPRSGTTLARTLLRSVSPIYLPPDEFQILRPFLTAAPRDRQALLEGSVFAGHMIRRGIWPGKAHLERICALPEPADAFQALVEAIAEREKAGEIAYWGDKTPENVFELPLIAETWPEVRILHVVRDARDTVWSMHSAWGRSLVRGSVVWRDAIRAVDAIEKTLPEGRVKTLSYEDMTDDPAAALAPVAAWLDVPFDASGLAEVTSEERWGTAAGQKGVRKRGPGWEKRMTKAQITQVEAIGYAEMTALGQTPRHASAAQAPSDLALKLAKAGDGWRVLRSYAKERGWAGALSYKIRQWRGSRQG